MAISENTMVKNVYTLAEFMLNRLNHGAGNGHFMEEGLHYRYMRNGKQIMGSEGTVIFDNGQYSQITIPEITGFNSPRMMDVFYSTRDVFKLQDNVLKSAGGRKNCGNCGRYEVKIW